MISIQELRKREREEMEKALHLSGDSAHGEANGNPDTVPADAPRAGIMKFARFIKR